MEEFTEAQEAAYRVWRDDLLNSPPPDPNFDATAFFAEMVARRDANTKTGEDNAIKAAARKAAIIRSRLFR